MRFAIMSVGVFACLLASPSAQAQEASATPTIVASGDFDGDGKPDTVEISRIGDIIEELVPGDSASRYIARNRKALRGGRRTGGRGRPPRGRAASALSPDVVQPGDCR